MSYWSSIRGHVDQSVGLRRSARARVPHDTALGRRAEALCERCGPVRLSARSGSGGSAGGGRRVRFALGRDRPGRLGQADRVGSLRGKRRAAARLGPCSAGRACLESGRVDRGRYRIAYSRSAGIHRRPGRRRRAGRRGARGRPSAFPARVDFPCAESEGDRPALCTGKRPGIRGYESDRRAHGRRYIGRRSSPGAGRRREQCAGRATAHSLRIVPDRFPPDSWPIFASAGNFRPKRCAE